MNPPLPLPDRNFLLECFDYNPRTGILKWKVRPNHHFSAPKYAATWNKRYAGRIAGCQAFSKKGNPAAILIRLNDIAYVAHRLIYGIMGELVPDGMEIDHRNRNPFVNRWKNLRLATRTQNVRNKSGYSRKGLPKGVAANGALTFLAQITVNRERIYLGNFPTIEQAHQAYRTASKRFHGEFGFDGSSR